MMFYLFLVVVFNILIRWLISLNEYSGYNKPPMYGDYEAQRHWMEITYNLPYTEWYQNSSKNDLLYWGLDYPPLTAYHSLIMGYVANKINPEWVELENSRGLTDESHKLFMRYSVLLPDIVIYMTAVVYYWYLCSKDTKLNWVMITLINLFYPGLILIDHGHFQYNCISLGLFIWAMCFLKLDYNCLASIMFIFALNYKQMELYHALPIFAYLFGLCINNIINKIEIKKNEKWKVNNIIPQEDASGDKLNHTVLKNGLYLFFKLAVTTILTFIICWYPFINSSENFMNVFKRMFPFNRGLYEDKVANFWCATSMIVKFKEIFGQSQLIMISAILTICGSLPSFVKCVCNPTMDTLRLSLVNVSLSFFLFSFQVHEKSILLVAIPIMLLLPSYPYSCINFLMVSYVSMYPLYVKDNLILPYYALFVMYFLIFCHEWLTSKKDIATLWYKSILYYTSLVVGLLLCLSLSLIKPPDRYPDLWPLIICVYGAIHFFYYLTYFNQQIIFAEGMRQKKNV